MRRLRSLIRRLLCACAIGSSAWFVPLADQRARAEIDFPSCCVIAPDVIEHLNSLPSEAPEAAVQSISAYVQRRTGEELEVDAAALYGYCGSDCTGVFRMAQVLVDRERSFAAERRLASAQLDATSHQPEAAVRPGAGPRRPTRTTRPIVPDIADGTPIAPSPFATATLRELSAWMRPLEEIPAWLDTRLKDSSVQRLRIVGTTLAAHCEALATCPAPLILGRKHIENLLGDRLRADERQAEQKSERESVRLAVWAMVVSAIVAVLSAIMSAWVTLRSMRKGDERMKAVITAFSDALSQLGSIKTPPVKAVSRRKPRTPRA